MEHLPIFLIQILESLFALQKLIVGFFQRHVFDSQLRELRLPHFNLLLHFLLLMSHLIELLHDLRHLLPLLLFILFELLKLVPQLDAV